MANAVTERTTLVNKPQPALGVLTLLGVMYTASISGGYGLEAAVAAAGPFLTVLSLIVIPLCWGIPTALSIAELACAIPSNAGPAMWVNVAFTPLVTGTVVMISVLLNFVDNSMYPTVYADYCAQMFGLKPLEEALVKTSFIWLCALINILGVSIVGNVSVVVMCITVAPFAAMFALQLPYGFNWQRISEVPEAIDWAVFLPVVCWNFSGFDSCGNFAEEVKNPTKTIPRALLLLVAAATATYIPPVLVGASAQSLSDVPWAEWDDGFWVRVGQAVGGVKLAHVVLIGSLFSSFGMMTGMMATTSRSLAGAGVLGFFPAPLSGALAHYHTRLRTPVTAIIVNALLTNVLSVASSFTVLVQADQVLYALRLAAIMAAFLKLRWSQPDLPRPYRVPGGAFGAWVAGGLPFVFSMILVGVSAAASHAALTATLLIVAMCAAASAISLYVVRKGVPFEVDGVIVV